MKIKFQMNIMWINVTWEDQIQIVDVDTNINI
jgi:hypothetical protein